MQQPGASDLDLVRWSEALAGIARTGLAFTDNLYERERYEEVLKVAAEIRAARDRGGEDDERPEEILEAWLSSVGHGILGYVTPKVAVGAVVGNDDGELLLIQRADSGLWLYPTGWADIGYSPAEVAVKEVGEETGIEAEPVRILAVYDGMRLGVRSLPFWSVLFHCRAVGGKLTAHPLETRDVGWFGRDRLPGPLAGNGWWLDLAFAAVRGEPIDVIFDPPRSAPWTGHDAHGGDGHDAHGRPGP
ncbi:MAG: NUDIX hydrolase N-terminal domain-containing protein [Acidimicrobiaceae bacterium]|nr:NUDIX hydrolase N-terminal domain-containing protein [Acidimicrobiaceae bacterium]MBO0748493.1 NUDIX hydrolase N-terminal domain-containing protein [Acidimicrobiaceae bacterium]